MVNYITDIRSLQVFRAVPLEFDRGREFKICYAICISGIVSRGGGDIDNPAFRLWRLVLGHGLRRVNSKGENSSARTNSKSKSTNETLASSNPQVPPEVGASP